MKLTRVCRKQETRVTGQQAGAAQRGYSRSALLGPTQKPFMTTLRCLIIMIHYFRGEKNPTKIVLLSYKKNKTTTKSKEEKNIKYSLHLFFNIYN